MNTKLLLIIMTIMSLSTIFINANAKELTKKANKTVITQNFSLGSHSWQNNVTDYKWSKQQYADAVKPFWWMGVAGIITGGVGLITLIPSAVGASFAGVVYGSNSITYIGLSALSSLGATLFFFIGPILTATGFTLSAIFKDQAGGKVAFAPIITEDEAGLLLTMKL